MTPPCGVPLVGLLDHAVFHHACHEPLPQQLEHPPVRDAPSHQLHQFLVVDAPEVVPDVGVKHVVVPLRAELPQRLQGHRRAPLGAEAVRGRTEARHEDRLQHQLRRHLRPLGPVPSESQAAASSHQPSGCTGAAPLPADTSPASSTSRALRGSAPRRTARASRSSQHRPPRPPCSASLASTPSARTSLLAMRSYNAWKRRPG